ncbi:hypothetical protein KY290_036767 [Solanum tuberosum]|uniref:Uncharacterized protein n=1 Tax=Solanum tuberosum TaxID=4113 RepID=A0ABQ7TVA2_SOLTU|nr:hypothetical protein KY285_036086 [Solanum tuberosum]KAH0738062.1 hypothetical protein KY290_036767 [Solanum tuberosum]
MPVEWHEPEVELERLLLSNKHAMTIVLDEEDTVCRSIRSYMFRAAREWASFRSIVSTANEEELMVLEEIGEPMRTRSSGLFFCALSEGRCSHKGHMMRQCPLETYSGPQRSYLGVPARDSTPPGGGKGSTQTAGGWEGQCYAFPRRPEAEIFDGVITRIVPVFN